MIIKSISAIPNKITYWYYATPTAKQLTMKERYYVMSWMPDLDNNLVSIQQLVESYKDFTHSEFILELLMLITEYQQHVVDETMSNTVFKMKINNLNYHLNKNNINIKIEL